MKLLRWFLKISIALITLLAFYFIFIILYNTIFDYKPKSFVNILPESSLYDVDTLSIISWNIGYAGLGEKMDFFYEGGTTVRPPKKYYNTCLNDIVNYISLWEKKTDIMLLQEVDFNSMRSYNINQKYKLLEKLRILTFSDSLINYKVPFIPFPLFQPMGKVCAGLVTLSQYKPTLQARMFFKNTYSWPKHIFFLDRGALIHGYQLNSGKWLFVINIHLSAFEDAQTARFDEMSLIKAFIEKIVSKGHYVIVGGDWNINPPSFKLSLLNNKNPVYQTEINPFSFSENFTHYYDTLHATNRMVNTPFKETTPVTTLDYFLVSKNINVIHTEVIPLNFRLSDHNPVRIICALQ